MEDSLLDNPDTSETAGAANQKTGESPKAEVSASTIGRMMGLATVSDLKMIDTKLDLVATKVTGLVVKLDKVMSTLNAMPTAADMERIDVQVGSVKTALRESLTAMQDMLSGISKHK